MARERKITLSIDEAARLLGISRICAYEAVRRGEIPVLRIGRRILVPRTALDEMIAKIPGGAEAART